MVLYLLPQGRDLILQLLTVVLVQLSRVPVWSSMMAVYRPVGWWFCQTIRAWLASQSLNASMLVGGQGAGGGGQWMKPRWTGPPVATQS